MTTILGVIIGSQWSLTFEVRKSRKTRGILEAITTSQWSLTFEVRKSGSVVSPLLVPALSQWSLTFEVRKRQLEPVYLFIDMPVAMEPDL